MYHQCESASIEASLVIYVVVMDDVEALGAYGQYIIDGYAQGLVECTTMTSQYVVGGVEYKTMCAQPPAW